MVRVDIWDVQKPEDLPPIDCGLSRGFNQRFVIGQLLGKGGFGRVNIVTETVSGRQYACKTIAKRLDVPNLSPQKQATHLDNVRREVAVLSKLKGVLSVAQLKETLEDDTNIYIIMEYCKGGELLASLGKRHYSEATVASYIRAVLRTLVQCHAQHILHRDIKPGNFMLLEDNPLSPVKAIDFGLAVFFEPGSLPRHDLGLEGTPWFMSPEMLSSEVGPPADVWAAGVMAYQLLSGFLPFDDHKNRESPALSMVWRAILTEEVNFKGKYWDEVPEAAKDFIKQLLNKDPSSRPTAKQALQHEWLKDRHKVDRASGVPLSQTVVQRIQRYGQGNVLKRSILELIAEEIIKMVPEVPELSLHGDTAMPIEEETETTAGVKREAEGSMHATTMDMLSSFKRRKSRRDLHLPDLGPGGGAMEGPPLIHREHHSSHGGMQYFKVRGESVHDGQEALKQSGHDRPASVHGGRSYWRMMRMAAASKQAQEGSPDTDYARYMPRDEGEREEQQKVARLAMDTSSHASLEYKRYLRQLSSSNLTKRIAQTNANGGSDGSSALSRAQDVSAGVPKTKSGALERRSLPSNPNRQLFPVATSSSTAEDEGSERRVRGHHAYRQFLQGYQGSWADLQRQSLSPHAAASPTGSFQEFSLGFKRSASMEVPQRNAASLDLSRSQPEAQLSSGDASGLLGSLPDLPGMPATKKVSFASLGGQTPAGSRNGSVAGSPHNGSLRGSRSFWDHLQEGNSNLKPAAGSSTPPDTSFKMPDAGSKPRDSSDLGVQEMRDLMRRLNFGKEVERVSEEELAEGLKNLGYRLRPEEMTILAQQVDPKRTSGAISKYAFLASQIDWHRDDLRELWIEAAKRVFQGIETAQGRGTISYAQLTDMIRHKIPEREIEYAVEDALVAGGYADEEELDFDGFMRLLKADKVNNLAYFESRLPKSDRREPQQSEVAFSSELYGQRTPSNLPSVAEHRQL